MFEGKCFAKVKTMMGTKPIINRSLSKWFMYHHLTLQCLRNITSAMLTNVTNNWGPRSNKTCFRLLTNENIIYMSKIVTLWHKNCTPFNFYSEALQVR